MEDRVRNSTPYRLNQKIDDSIKENIAYYATKSKEEISHRIKALDREWDIERLLEVNMSTLALTGIALSVTKHIRWLLLPTVVLGFFAQHAIQGWCPPLPILRKLGYRTRGEIDQEKYALKLLRGDFSRAAGQVKVDADPETVFHAVRS